MSWRDAPLYLAAADLATWVIPRTVGWSSPDLAQATAGAARELVEHCAVALTFPAERAEALRRADLGVVALRERLRLARALGLLSAGQHRYATGRLAEIGRMIGGWRRRRGPARDSPMDLQGAGHPAVTGG